jgi:uncharacterized protein (TIRG00374 family)
VTRPRISVSALVRLAIAAALVGYLLRRSNPQDVWHALAHATTAPLLIAVALVLLDRAVMAYRWFVLLGPLESQQLPPFATILRIFFVSTFVGTFLPASVGGDVVRAYSLSNHGVSKADSMASVFVDRMLGVLSVLLMALVGITLARELAADRAVLLALAVTAGACLVTAVLIFSNTADAMAEKVFARLPWAWARRVLASLFTSIRRYAAHHRALSHVLIGSIGVQVLRVVQAYYLGMALGITQPLITYFAFIPLILLIMFLPITANGIGTSQAAFVWLFHKVGTSSAEAFALSVLFVALGIVGNIPGAIFYINRGSSNEISPRDAITS